MISLVPVYRCQNCGVKWAAEGREYVLTSIGQLRMSQEKQGWKDEILCVQAEGYKPGPNGYDVEAKGTWRLFSSSEPLHFCPDGRVGLSQLVAFEVNDEAKERLRELADLMNPRLSIREETVLEQLGNAEVAGG